MQGHQLGPLRRSKRALVKKRRRFKQTTSLQTRLNQEAVRLKRKARGMRPGKERSILIGKARQMEEAAQIADFLAVQQTSAGG